VIDDYIVYWVIYYTILYYPICWGLDAFADLRSSAAIAVETFKPLEEVIWDLKSGVASG